MKFLCLKWVITDQFHEYLYGNTFDIYTDNNPLTYVITTAKLDALGHRWIAGLANFHIHYRSGKSNVEADALSQIEWEKCNEIETIQSDSIQAIVTAVINGHEPKHIESTPFRYQIADSFFPSMSDDIPIISTDVIQSSRQSHPGCLEVEADALE